jgi:plasmid maintenance system antidote protein VapI
LANDRGQRAVAEETALRLARNLGGSATIWQCLRAT